MVAWDRRRLQLVCLRRVLCRTLLPIGTWADTLHWHKQLGHRLLQTHSCQMIRCVACVNLELLLHLETFQVRVWDTSPKIDAKHERLQEVHAALSCNRLLESLPRCRAMMLVAWSLCLNSYEHDRTSTGHQHSINPDSLQFTCKLSNRRTPEILA
jgi:hypothetical protein